MRPHNIFVKRFRMSRDDAQKLTNAIYYGTRAAAQEMYEFNRSVYDEDAGVFTDYGTNEPARTWANVHFTSLCSHAVINVEWGKQPVDPVYVTLLDMAIGAVVQLIWCLWSNDQLQRRILKSRGVDLWESDGHYAGKTRDGFVEEVCKDWWLSREQGRRICDLLQEQYSSDVVRLQGRLVVGETPRDIRAQLVDGGGI